MANDRERTMLVQGRLLRSGKDITLGQMPLECLAELILPVVPPALNETSFQIRLARNSTADLTAILRLIRGFAECVGLDHLMAATEASLETLLFGPRPDAIALLAFLDDECVGYTLFFTMCRALMGQRVMVLDHLYVNPEFRDREVGSALLEHVAAITLERGCGLLECLVPIESRQAINFFRDEGAELTTTWTACSMTEAALKRLALGCKRGPSHTNGGACRRE